MTPTTTVTVAGGGGQRGDLEQSGPGPCGVRWLPTRTSPTPAWRPERGTGEHLVGVAAAVAPISPADSLAGHRAASRPRAPTWLAGIGADVDADDAAVGLQTDLMVLSVGLAQRQQVARGVLLERGERRRVELGLPAERAAEGVLGDAAPARSAASRRRSRSGRCGCSGGAASSTAATPISAEIDEHAGEHRHQPARAQPRRRRALGARPTRRPTGKRARGRAGGGGRGRAGERGGRGRAGERRRGRWEAAAVPGPERERARRWARRCGHWLVEPGRVAVKRVVDHRRRLGHAAGDQRGRSDLDLIALAQRLAGPAGAGR